MTTFKTKKTILCIKIIDLCCITCVTYNIKLLIYENIIFFEFFKNYNYFTINLHKNKILMNFK